MATSPVRKNKESGAWLDLFISPWNDKSATSEYVRFPGKRKKKKDFSPPKKFNSILWFGNEKMIFTMLGKFSHWYSPSLSQVVSTDSLLEAIIIAYKNRAFECLLFRENNSPGEKNAALIFSKKQRQSNFGLLGERVPWKIMKWHN